MSKKMIRTVCICLLVSALLVLIGAANANICNHVCQPRVKYGEQVWLDCIKACCVWR